MSAVDDVLLRAPGLAGAGLPARLQWLEDSAAAIESAELGDDGTGAVLQLRAALGAIVSWSQGVQDERSVVELEAIVRLLTTRGLLLLTRAMAEYYGALVDDRAPRRMQCREIALAYGELAAALQRGEALPEAALARVKAVAATLEKS